MARYRRERLGDQIRVELADLIQRDVRDPRVGFVTFTEVRLSKDYHYARVYVSVLGDAERRAEALAALERASGFLKTQVGRRLKLRATPELRFVLDETLDFSERIEQLLDDGAPGDDDE